MISSFGWFKIKSLFSISAVEVVALVAVDNLSSKAIVTLFKSIANSSAKVIELYKE